MNSLVLLAVSIAVCIGCKQVDPAYCENPVHAGTPGCRDAGGSLSCKSNAECAGTPGTPACDLMDNGGTCVQCTANDHAACSGGTPICPNHACVACTNDSDCGTDGLCLPTGACAASNSIIHVSATGLPAGACGAKNQPCSLANALAAVDAVRNVIKIDDSGPYINNGAGNFYVTTNATIVAGNAVLHRNVAGPILSISDNTAATIVGGTIEGALAPNGDGIACGTNSTLTVYGTIIQSNDTFGIQADGCNVVTLSRSQILSNKRGGVGDLFGKFAFVGNVFANNGDSNNPNSAVKVSTGFDPMNRLEFNTIANNTAQSGVNAGVDCIAGTGFTAHNNIIWNNTGLAQITGNCSHSYSDIGPFTGPIVPGTGNKKDDPMLTSTWHLGTGSPAIRGADPQADLTGIAAKDVDGDMRVAPAEMGADQVPR
jgi:Right handed beta helix region